MLVTSVPRLVFSVSQLVNTWSLVFAVSVVAVSVVSAKAAVASKDIESQI